MNGNYELLHHVNMHDLRWSRENLDQRGGEGH
jgi:hypothetical protein